MAVLSKSTDIRVGDEERLIKIFSEKPNPSKSAFDRISKAKNHPIYKKAKQDD